MCCVATTGVPVALHSCVVTPVNDQAGDGSQDLIRGRHYLWYILVPCEVATGRGREEIMRVGDNREREEMKGWEEERGDEGGGRVREEMNGVRERERGDEGGGMKKGEEEDEGVGRTRERKGMKKCGGRNRR